MNADERKKLLDEEIAALSARVILAMAELHELRDRLHEKRRERVHLNFVPEWRAA